MRQRPGIEQKYALLYGVLAEHAKAFIAATPGSKRAKYEKLKEVLPALWAASIAMSAQGGISPLSFAEWAKIAADMNAAPRAWTERGVQIQATERDLESAMRRIATSSLQKYLPKNCKAVIDLGCGWGHRLFDFWVAHGPSRMRHWGGERAPAGRDIINLIAPLFPDMHVASLPFDFLSPDLTPVGGDPSTVLLYTFHAIEQVRTIGPALFDAIISRFPNAEVVGVHFEPFGFQTRPDDPPFAADRTYAEERGYNLDLFDCVSRHEKLEVLAVETGLLDFGGGNSTSLLAWRYRP